MTRHALIRQRLAGLLLAVIGAIGWTQTPAVPAIFRGADLTLGSRLIKEHRCSECHARRAGGDGSDIYNPKGRIASPGALRGMVELCNTEMNLGLKAV